MVYIYALLHPDTGKAHYVGKSKHPVKRLEEHTKCAALALRSWIEELEADGQLPALAILEAVGDEPDAWRPAENRWIGRLRDAGHPLTNHAVPTAAEREAERGRIMREALDRGRDLVAELED